MKFRGPEALNDTYEKQGEWWGSPKPVVIQLRRSILRLLRVMIFDGSNANFALASDAREVTTSPRFIARGLMASPDSAQVPVGTNAVEGYKASMNGDGLRILDHLPQIIERGAEALTPAEKELLKWVGVFFRKPTPGKFMMRIRMPNGF